VVCAFGFKFAERNHIIVSTISHLSSKYTGGYCDQCPPEKYIETAQTFAQSCLEGDHVGNGDTKEVLDSYDEELISRAVHMIRDPFDNIVSRFHLTYKYFVKANKTVETAKYPRSKEGFRAFCKDMGKRFVKEVKASKAYNGLYDEVKNVPCYADFFRYIQWHNLAFAATQDLSLPTMIIHYENYTHAFDETKDRLLEFLEQEEIHEPPQFEAGKTYREYFTDDEVQAVSKMFYELAQEKTWDHTKHYFD